MRRWLWVGVALVALLLVYYGSAIAGVMSLAKAVQAGDGTAVLAQTDQASLRRSLVTQVLDVYLDPANRAKPASSRDRFLAQTLGATVADAMIARMLTAENLTQILREGKLAATADTPAVTIPNLAGLNTSKLGDLMTRVRPVDLTRIAIRLSKESDAENDSSVRLRFNGTGWRLSELRLPRAILRDMADKVGARPAG